MSKKIWALLALFAVIPVTPTWSWAVHPFFFDYWKNSAAELKISPQCRQSSEQIVSLVDDYARAAELNKSFKSKKFQKEIQKLLENAQASGHACFTPMAHAYAIAALLLIGKNGLQREYAIAAAVLAREGLLAPITTTLRKEMGGIWKDRILGAYDCAATRIFFDPALSPVNLGVTLIHEFDHLFRDKLSDPRGIALNMREWVLLDESLASVHGAFTGVRMTTPMWPHRKVKLPFQSDVETIYPFSLKTDNNLYSRNGNLYALWNAIPLDNGGFKHALSFYNLVRETLPSGELHQNYIGLFDIVSATYFDSRIGELEPLVAVLSRSLAELEPMESWIERHDGTYLSGQSVIGAQFSNRTGIFRRKSSGCERFEQSLKSGELNDYIGSSGLRPGSEGVRPTLTTRPCLKPGSDF